MCAFAKTESDLFTKIFRTDSCQHNNKLAVKMMRTDLMCASACKNTIILMWEPSNAHWEPNPWSRITVLYVGSTHEKMEKEMIHFHFTNSIWFCKCSQLLSPQRTMFTRWWHWLFRWRRKCKNHDETYLQTMQTHVCERPWPPQQRSSHVKRQLFL